MTKTSIRKISAVKSARLSKMAVALLGTVPFLAACSGSGTSAKAPFASLYVASYAEPDKVIEDVLSAKNTKIEGVTVSNSFTFGDEEAVGLAKDPRKITIERLFADDDAGGNQQFIRLTVGTLSVDFTRDDLRGDDGEEYLKKVGLNDDDEERTIADLNTFGSILEVGQQIMVPLEYFIRVKDGALGPVNDSTGYIKGFAIVGLETKPVDMPKDGTATYDGKATLSLTNKTETYGIGTDQIRYDGDTNIVANFSSGKISGDISITREQVSDYGNSDTDDDLDGSGKLVIDGSIIENGFAFDLTANKAAADRLVDLGITDADAGGAGRFYGTEADAVGGLLSGTSSNYLIDGIFFGYKDED